MTSPTEPQNETENLQLEPEGAPALDFPRGVAPKILLEQVRNTIPFLFDGSMALGGGGNVRDDARGAARPGTAAGSPHLERLRSMDAALTDNPDLELEHDAYYALCVSAHHATVATMVPTDVDNQIRFKLWYPALPDETLFAMVDTVLESRSWDCRPVSTRWVQGPQSGKILSGHAGEWLGTAVAAYGALRNRAPERALEVREAILAEVAREAAIYQELKQARDGIGLLKAATVIAHNLGDLDRVIDMWSLPDEDPLKLEVYKTGHTQPKRYRGALVEAGGLNKAGMADENHRNFALRGPRCLRREAKYLVPIGPFLDGWGETVGGDRNLEPEEVGEVVEALVGGWEWLNKSGTGPVGYARAITGMLEAFPGGANRLYQYVPARVARTLKAGTLRTLSTLPRRRFEEQWAKMALNFVK